MGSLAGFLSSDGFMPHGHCFLWTPPLLWTYVLSDAMIGLAYYSIPVALWYFVRRRADLPFTWMFVMFAAFIFACGTTHVMAIWNIWQPVYWLDAGVKIVTATVSLATAVLLWPLMPKALSLPSPGRLEQANRELANEVSERRQVERSLGESQRLLQAVADNSAAIIWVKDLEGRYLLIHGRYERLFDLRREEIIGKTDYELLPAERADIFRAVDQQALAAGTAVQAEEAAFHAGESATYLSVKCPLCDDRGEPYALCGISTDITEHKRAEQERSTLAAIVESSEDAIISITLDGTIESWNRGAEKVYGYAADEAKGRNLSILVPADRRDEQRRTLERIRQGEGVTDYETVRVRKDGRRIDISLTLSPVKDAAGQIIGASGIGRDITERKQAEEALRIAAITFQTQEGIMITDRGAKIERVNRAFTKLTGYSAEEVIGRTPALLKSGRHDQQFYQEMWEALGRENYWQGELWNRRKDGEVCPVRMTISAVQASDGRVTHYVGSFADITHRKEAEAQLHRLAFYDPLTELPNRRLLLERLRQAFAASARNGQHGAILYIDLDHFKTLNDTKGHDVGDQLLTEVAVRLLACVRGDDSVARLGGDEFVVMLEDLSKQQDTAAKRAEAVAEKIRTAVAQPYAIGGHEYHSTASIGVSLFFDHMESAEEVLKRADTALYRAKAGGRNTVRFFDPSLQAALEAHAALLEALRHALALHQLKLYVQMQADSTRRIVGAEMLLRWKHPQRGLVSPVDFIPLAEESGLIVPIGLWVLETACAQLKMWAAQPLIRELQLAVNVSTRQFRQPDFVAQVRRVLELTGADPTRLTLELTESVLLDDVEYTIAMMHALKSLGVRFSMDDFGTGYSSLSYLKRLPLDQLKIDRSFVLDIDTNPNAAVIVQTIIGMAKNLRLEVLAEGVETEEQLEFLTRHGCFAFQGSLFSPPLPVADFESLVAQQSPVRTKSV